MALDSAAGGRDRRELSNTLGKARAAKSEKKEARQKALQMGKETLIKGQESSIAVAKMKNKLEDEEAKAKAREWKERQERHKAEEEAARQKQLEEQAEFKARPHGAHLHTPLGEMW